MCIRERSIRYKRQHSGILFLSAINNEDINGVVSVSVPSFGDSFFIHLPSFHRRQHHHCVSVPSFGDSFFMFNKLAFFMRALVAPLTHSGILFLCLINAAAFMFDGNGVSVPSFGDSFFISRCGAVDSRELSRFRPLIRGFFFYADYSAGLRIYGRCDVSVPSFGDSFFIRHGLNVTLTHLICFRPLIRGFFFYRKMSEKELADYSAGVSVPSFGDSFFI